MKIKYLDLFSGIGGFTLGILQAGIKIDEHYFSEVNKYATKIYKNHFPEATGLGAVESVCGYKLPRLNIVSFGFPCQDLSIAGKRTGLKGARSGLFYEALRVINENKPDYIIFENVKGLFSSNGGKDFGIVLQKIANAGYNGQWNLLNSAWFLPQNRERIYFIGHLRGRSMPEVFPIEGKNCEIFKTIGEDVSYSIVANYHKGTCNINKGRLQLVAQSARKIRRLTPIECERLQGFPDNWTSGISDTQRYKCLGNAVSVPVVKCIMEKLKNTFNEKGGIKCANSNAVGDVR